LISKPLTEVDELQEGEKVRESQERLLQCLQTYTIARCPESPSKFGELLLKIPELQRICQVLAIITVKCLGVWFVTISLLYLILDSLRSHI